MSTCKLPVRPADILLPADGTDLSKWGVVACDQFTSDPAYWEAADAFVGSSPSTLRLTLPEIYLNDNTAQRTADINAAMEQYMQQGLFREYKNSVIYVERTLASGAVRKGLMLAFDLEAYDYSPDSTSLIRATEGTVPDRLPPRIALRCNAPLELPHIMILMNDPASTVFGSFDPKDSTGLYNAPLMAGGGSVKGFLLSPSQQNSVFAAIEALSEPAVFAANTGLPSETPVLLFAMGDGNHSLACAKACWERIKPSLSPAQRLTHPARFALAELQNIYDSSLMFEPIHRVVFGAGKELLDAISSPNGNGQSITAVVGNREYNITVPAVHTLPVGSLQAALDGIGGLKLDYVHEEATVRKLAAQGGVGFILPPFEKSLLFTSVAKNGPLPRKTFSMGAGCDKRYYFEARKIRL